MRTSQSEFHLIYNALLYTTNAGVLNYQSNINVKSQIFSSFIKELQIIFFALEFWLVL